MKNICIISRSIRYAKDIAKQISSVVEKKYLDIDEYIAYEMMNVKKATQIYGNDYFYSKQNKIIGGVMQFENVVFFIDAFTYSAKDVSNHIKDVIKVYIDISDELLIEEIELLTDSVRYQRENQLSLKDIVDKKCKSDADIIVNANDYDLSRIIAAIKGV